MQSPYQVFNNWLFDADINSEIPQPKYDKDGNQITPDLLKYNSPITPQYLIKLFMKDQRLNHYLNEVFNNFNLRYMPKDEFFKFIKKCVIDFKIKRNSLMFFSYNRKSILFNKLSDKLPMFKPDDILLICDNIEKSDNRDYIYNSLGILKEKNQVVKNKKQTKKNSSKISLQEVIKNNFSIEEVSLI